VVYVLWKKDKKKEEAIPTVHSQQEQEVREKTDEEDGKDAV
jgi:hypothetical protein